VRAHIRIDGRTRSTGATERIARHEVEAAVVEEAILQFGIEVAAERHTHASQSLPCEAGIGIIGRQRIKMRTRNARTASDKALKAVIRDRNPAIRSA
jgi:aspartate aminotransferase-like enzyme